MLLLTLAGLLEFPADQNFLDGLWAMALKALRLPDISRSARARCITTAITTPRTTMVRGAASASSSRRSTRANRWPSPSSRAPTSPSAAPPRSSWRPIGRPCRRGRRARLIIGAVQTAQAGAGQRIDVLIVTAVAEEYAAVVAVETGAVERSGWDARKASTGLEIRVRPFVAAGRRDPVDRGDAGARHGRGRGGERGGAARAGARGAVPGDVRGVRGRRGEVALGDVIIADRMWTYDTGKSKVEVSQDGRRIETERGDMEMYRLAPPAWKHDAERFKVIRGRRGWRRGHGATRRRATGCWSGCSPGSIRSTT